MRAHARTTTQGGLVAVMWMAASGVVLAQADAQEFIELRVGEQTTISARGVKSFSEGTPGIIDVRVPPNSEELVVVGLRTGETSLLLLRERGRKVNYAVRVYDATVTNTAPSGAIRVPERVNIRLDFYFVGLSETYSHQIGVGWPGSVGGAGVGQLSATMDLQAGALAGATASLVNQPLPRLDVAQSQGWARVYRHAVMITGNGHQAQFTSGGEHNALVQGALTADVRSIEFGSDVRVQPRYDEKSGRIEVAIQADVSDLEEVNASGLPNRSRSSLQTLVTMEVGQGVVLAGLTGQRKRRSTAGLPGLSQIPIIGLLFGSDREAREDSDTLLFIVPTVVRSVPRSHAEIVKEVFTIYNAYSGDIEESRLLDSVLVSPGR
ncbi:MAG: pilus assembly protein N-terminal domain-containing protein [Myxococcales bacterium]|nr:pilus assembly protein N-terminal domain-containing protein [Myxococcales bacterium]